jgi:hypothetical protein
MNQHFLQFVNYIVYRIMGRFQTTWIPGMRLGPGGRHDEALLLRISQGGIRRATGVGDLHDPRVSQPQFRDLANIIR